MGHCNQDGGVAEQVDDEPELVAHPPSHCHKGGDDHADEETQPEESEGKIWQGEHPDNLCNRVDSLGEAIAGDEQRRVCEEEVEGRLTEGAVKCHGPVEADGTVDQGDARGQHQHDKNEVGADKSGDYAETRDRGAGRPKIGCPAAREEERNGSGRGTPAGRDEEVCCARASAKPFGSVVPAIRPLDAASWCAGPHTSVDHHDASSGKDRRRSATSPECWRTL